MSQQARWDGRNSQSGRWTAHVMTELAGIGRALLGSIPADIGSFSLSYPGWTAEIRAQFWTFLISAICEFESDFNPSETYTESFGDARGQPVVSMGLLQISFESANGHRYDCRLARPDDLLDPLINLTCGIKILQALVIGDGVVSRVVGSKYFGASRYWSTLRPNHQRHPLENIQHWCHGFVPVSVD